MKTFRRLASIGRPAGTPFTRAEAAAEDVLAEHLATPRANALLLAAGRGDSDAFATLFDRTAPVVLGLLYRALPSRAAAAKLIENAYVHLWRTAPRFQPEHLSAHGRLLRIVCAELVRENRASSGA